MFEGMAQTFLPGTNTFWTTNLLMRSNETVNSTHLAKIGFVNISHGDECNFYTSMEFAFNFDQFISGNIRISLLIIMSLTQLCFIEVQ